MSRVLVVGGPQDVREVIGEILLAAGQEVESLDCSLEAVKRLGDAENRFDLLIVNSIFLKDLPLPTFLRAIQPLVEGRTPVILVTAAPRETVRDGLPPDGAKIFAVLPKPFDVKDLLGLTRRALLALRIQNADESIGAPEPAGDERPLTVQEVLTQHERIGTAMALGLLDLLDQRAPGSLDHSLRVRKYVCRLGAAAGLEGSDLKAAARGGLLHDVGKCALPDQLLAMGRPEGLSDPGPLLDHGAQGAALLRGISPFEDCLEVIHHHHERFDGRGFPQGLRGDGIPIGARICAVVDAFDNVCEGWRGRSPKGHRRGKEAIESEAGRALDPELVTTFGHVIEEDIRGADP